MQRAPSGIKKAFFKANSEYTLRHFGVFPFPQDGVCDEEYARALENRRRTSRQVEDIDRSTLKRIEEKKLAFQQISSRQGAALRRAKKEAYFQG